MSHGEDDCREDNTTGLFVDGGGAMHSVLRP